VRQRGCPEASALRARIVLAAARGLGPSAVGRELGCSRDLARPWRDRYAAAVAGWEEVAAKWDEPTLAEPFDYAQGEVLDALEDHGRPGAATTHAERSRRARPIALL
jgi:hypothetical protein